MLPLIWIPYEVGGFLVAPLENVLFVGCVNVSADLSEAVSDTSNNLSSNASHESFSNLSLQLHICPTWKWGGQLDTQLYRWLWLQNVVSFIYWKIIHFTSPLFLLLSLSKSNNLGCFLVFFFHFCGLIWLSLHNKLGKRYHFYMFSFQSIAQLAHI